MKKSVNITHRNTRVIGCRILWTAWKQLGKVWQNAKLNENYQNVKDSYLFAEIARRVKVYEETHPEKAADIIRLGIGDVTLPLTKSVIEALHEAVDSQAVSETFKGYGPERGYAFAQEAIADYYARNGVEVKATDIFISDGSKEWYRKYYRAFAKDNVVLVPDPVLPCLCRYKQQWMERILSIWTEQKKTISFQCRMKM